MCIIKIRRADPSEPETPVIVPIRPISRAHQPTSHPTSAVSPRASVITNPRMSQLPPPRVSAENQSHEYRRSSSQQQIVIASPRTSRPKMPTIQRGSAYSYGSGPVPARESLERLGSQQQQQQYRRRYSGQQVGRRSTGSVTFGPSDPRASHVSQRSARERIVIVDETGRRRETGFH